MIKFKTFIANYHESAAERLTCWLAEHHWVELISWQASPVGNKAEVSITIQYKED
jgi:hypothetical protein